MKRLPPRNGLIALGLLALCAGFLSGRVALASGLQISPVRVDLSAEQSSEKLTLTNTSDVEVVVEAGVFRWQQSGGQDLLTATRALALSGEIFALQPGETQTILVGLLAPPEKVESEISYRLLLRSERLPAAVPASGTRISLSVSIPIFLVPADDGAPALTAGLFKGQDASSYVHLRNDGRRFLRLYRAEIRESAGGVLSDVPLGNYLLPGAEIDIPLATVDRDKVGSVRFEFIWGGAPNELRSQELDISRIREGIATFPYDQIGSTLR